jgi:XRE family transcriptional regulator, regulator of sulfur utilization
MSQLLQSGGSARAGRIVTARDVKVAVLTAVITLGAAGWMRAQTAVMGSRVFLWESLKVGKTNVGERRDLVRAPTATLDELEMHITTLQAGEQSHPPHQHVAEELLIIKEGTLDSLVNGETKRVSAGSVIFQASNQPHTIRNVGTGPATYHVIQWLSPGMKK